MPIPDTIEEASGREVAAGSIYITLNRLEAKGLVTSHLGESTPERGGRAKTYYQITGKGVRAVRQAQRTLVKLWSGVPRLEGGVSDEGISSTGSRPARLATAPLGIRTLCLAEDARNQLLRGARMPRPTNPPGAALWLLERLGPQSESVAGDITERFSAHQHSAAWVWRQVFATIVVAAVRDIRQHKLLAMTSLVVGFGLIQSFAVFFGGPIVNRVSGHGSDVDAALVTWPVWSAGFVAIGVVIARMSRPVHGAMVLLFASVVMLPSMFDNYGLLKDALERPVFWSRLLLFVSRDVTWTLCVVAGGVWANTTASVARLGKSRRED